MAPIRQHDDPEAVRAFAARVPDLPQWVDVRGALLGGRSTVFSADADDRFVVATPHVPLVSIVGDPDAALVDAAIAFTEARAGDTPVLLVDTTHAGLIGELLPNWTRQTAVLHTRREGGALPAPGLPADVRWIECGAADAPAQLAHVGEDLRDELVDASASTAIACAWADGRAAAFAYTPWQTERWFDISIDTDERFRRRGLGRACVEALIARYAVSGRQPVWGALAVDAASTALAKALGFEPVAEVAIFERDSDEPEIAW